MIMRAPLFIFIPLILYSCTQPSPDYLSQAQRDISILASDSLEGREVGTKGETLAAAYISRRFGALGLSPAGTEGWYQPFFVKESQNPHEKAVFSAEDSLAGTSGKNVLALMDNPGEEVVVVGAHFDHLGYGGFSSLHRGDSAVHNGADDNASGITAMFLIAEMLQQKKLQRDVLFIAFSGEEKGLWGSNFFVKNPTVDLKKVDFMINMDMVGRLDSAKGMAIHGTGTAPEWSQVIDTTNTVNLKVIKKESGVGPSDHTSFYLQDIPVLHFFTGQHADYHKPTDDAELINYEGIVRIANHITNIITHLDTQPKLSFQKTKDESRQGPRFTVSLGVVPDYLYDGKGMRIDGISEDKPAQKAGLEKGDVVIQLGDSTVTDMMSYMRALSSFKAGDTTEVTVDRNGEKQVYDIQF
ncbi:MAG: M28 family peptidase [Marinoscillum sp.]|uniref:M20/M25/M40 family metallo-hydrolase n=2 Tax=Marinoscillum sp. TaxID=2024838 RepID=UPI00330146C5